MLIFLPQRALESPAPSVFRLFHVSHPGECTELMFLMTCVNNLLHRVEIALNKQYNLGFESAAIRVFLL